MKITSLQKEIEEKLSNLPIVGPYKKHKLNIKPQINLADNLNHFLKDDSYPPFESDNLKNLYKEVLIEEDSSLSFINSNNVDLFFINGALEAVSLILKTFCCESEKVLTFVPTFPFYKDICNRLRLKFESISLKGENLDQLDIESAKRLDPKIIILCDPNNPISTRISSRNAQELISTFNNCLVIIDEAYIDFSNSPSNLRFLNEYNNLIIVRGMSKGWGMASLRLCAIFGWSKIIECLKRFCVPYPISKPSIEEALFKFSFEKKSIKHSWVLARQERLRVSTVLNKFPEIEKIYPSDTNFICIKFKGADKLHDYLLNKGILIENVTHIIPNGLRITIGKPYENDACLNEIKNFFKPTYVRINKGETNV